MCLYKFPGANTKVTNGGVMAVAIAVVFLMAMVVVLVLMVAAVEW